MSDQKPPFQAYKKHILVCTGPRCAPESAPSLYQGLKDKLKELKLHEGPNRILKSQCHCFGICAGGPIVAVYPEGVWYHHVTPELMDKLIRENLAAGRSVDENLLYPKKPSCG